MSDFSMIQVKDLAEQGWAVVPYAIAFYVTAGNAIKTIKPSEPQPQPIITLPEGKTPERNHINGVIIPGTRHKIQPADNSFYIKQGKYLFASLLGGFTAFRDIQGGWILEDIGLVEEPGYLIFSWTTQAEMQVSQRIIEQFASYLKKELEQETISIIINGQLKFI